MRPVRLEMTGFSAFRETAVVTFGATDLVALVGPTGSGKSSIIDAITFALYGSVSRYDDARLVEPVIHKLCTEARVRLDFEVGGAQYTAVRVVRRQASGGATTKEARLVRVDAEGAEQILAGTAREMGHEVEKAVGLSFEQFTKTVVLPQGDFAAFLHEDKGKRQELLRQLLDVGIYERMGTLARQRAAEAKGRVALLIEERDRAQAPSEVEVAELAARAKGLARLEKTVAQGLERLRAVQAGAAAAIEALDEIDREAHALAAIKVPPAVASLAASLVAADAACDRAAADLAAARTAQEASRATAEVGPDELATRLGIDVRRKRASLVAELAVVEAERAEGAGAVATTAEAAKVAAEVLVRAAAELDRARAGDLAAGLVATLVVGDECPVCRQVVAEVPDHDAGAELARAADAHVRAKRAAAEAQSAAEAAARRQALLDDRHGRLATELGEVEASIDLTRDDEALAADLEVAIALKESERATAVAVRRAEATAAKVQADRDQLRAEEARLRTGLTEARDSVVAGKPPAPAGVSLGADWEALAGWAERRFHRVWSGREKAKLAVEEAERGSGAVIDAMADACSPHGIDPRPDGIGERVARAATSAAHQLEVAEQARARVAELAERIDAGEQERAVHTEMGGLLSAKGFERWLLQEALDDLVARATERLMELSSGQFSLESADGDFFVRDHRNADELRNVRSLSGGETFLASLALALALAENIADLAAEGAPRLDSMFLDEGFGTLDPDTLDVVAASVEELSASGRLIGIVTHIRELADRMPVRFEVHKDSTTARVERVEV